MIALLLAMSAAAPLEAPVPLSAEQVLVVAATLARAGRPTEALMLYEGLDADPSPLVRVEAMARRALILDGLGRTHDAAVLMRRVVDARPAQAEARIGLARLFEKLGDIEGARRQLRAAQAGHLSPALVRLTERYANALRARAPYGWSVEFSLAPDSNINRATRSDTLDTVIGPFRIDQEAKARSGVGIGVNSSGFVRMPIAGNMTWLARVDATHSRYRDRSFNRSTVALSSGPELMVGRTRVNVEAGAGRSTFGGGTFQRWTQVSARAYRPLGLRTALGVSIAGANVGNLANRLQGGRSFSAALSVERAITANMGAQLSLTANRFAAKDPGYSTQSVEAGIGGWIDLGRVTLSASAAKGRLAADERLGLFPERRRDSTARFSAGATARSIRLLDFSPFARVNWERSKSSVEIWDYRRRRLELGVQRAF